MAKGMAGTGIVVGRILRKPGTALPTETYSRWGVYWGLSATEFYQVDLKLQREGFTRSNLQVFEDGTGAALHQAVWVKKKQ